MSFPILNTERLSLRQFLPDDAPRVQHLAGSKEVSAGTFLPYPYETRMAEQWIANQREEYEAGTKVNFAIALARDQTLIGSIGLEIAQAHRHARLSYWLGLSY